MIAHAEDAVKALRDRFGIFRLVRWHSRVGLQPQLIVGEVEGNNEFLEDVRSDQSVGIRILGATKNGNRMIREDYLTDTNFRRQIAELIRRFLVADPFRRLGLTAQRFEPRFLGRLRGDADAGCAGVDHKGYTTG